MVEVRFQGTANEVLADISRFASEKSLTAGDTAKVTKEAKKEKVTDTPSETKTPPEKKEDAAPDINTVKATITEMLAHAKVGKEGVIKLFADHFAPAKKASELPADPKVYAAFVEKAKALMVA